MAQSQHCPPPLRPRLSPLSSLALRTRVTDTHEGFQSPVHGTRSPRRRTHPRTPNSPWAPGRGPTRWPCRSETARQRLTGNICQRPVAPNSVDRGGCPSPGCHLQANMGTHSSSRVPARVFASGNDARKPARLCLARRGARFQVPCKEQHQSSPRDTFSDESLISLRFLMRNRGQKLRRHQSNQRGSRPNTTTRGRAAKPSSQVRSETAFEVNTRAELTRQTLQNKAKRILSPSSGDGSSFRLGGAPACPHSGDHNLSPRCPCHRRSAPRCSFPNPAAFGESCSGNCLLGDTEDTHRTKGQAEVMQLITGHSRLGKYVSQRAALGPSSER